MLVAAERKIHGAAAHWPPMSKRGMGCARAIFCYAAKWRMMTTFEKCQTIRKLIVNRAAEVMCYTMWSDEFAAKQIREIPDVLLERHPELGKIQPSELTEEECNSLGFGQWNADNPMRLIPIWLFPFLADEIQTTCIDGSSVLRKADMDNDHRYGCLAYGIMPSA